MYIISEKARNAFFQGRDFYIQNTRVETWQEITSLFLWEHKIAWMNRNTGAIFFCLCGRDTRTTCERLRALDIEISHKRGRLLAFGQKISDCAVYCAQDLIRKMNQQKKNMQGASDE